MTDEERIIGLLEVAATNIHQDKLTRDERIRLEALKCANSSGVARYDGSEIVDVAKQFEEYIRGESK